MKQFFVTGIDTDSGKTLASAILCEALQADYWKPVQSGLPRDTETVMSLISNSQSVAWPERYLLNTPASPHASAKIDGVSIRVKDFGLPSTSGPLVVEGAGGCLVPLNDEELVIDLIQHLALPAVIVADLYLGSINHTLLTFEALHRRNIPIAGIIFNGEENRESERIILKRTALPCLLKIGREKQVSKEVVKSYANVLKAEWKTIG